MQRDRLPITTSRIQDESFQVVIMSDIEHLANKEKLFTFEGQKFSFPQEQIIPVFSWLSESCKTLQDTKHPFCTLKFGCFYHLTHFLTRRSFLLKYNLARGSLSASLNCCPKSLTFQLTHCISVCTH